MKCTSKEWDHCRVEKMGCTGCHYDEYKLCYVDRNKAWFTNNFEKQWGDDWDDAPYEHNAGLPYDHWSELIEDNEDIFKRKWKHHEIKHKVLYFETEDWDEVLPCDNFSNSPYSVEAINKQAVAWIHTDKYNILAGTTMEEFIDIIEKHGGRIYLPRGKNINENREI